MIRIWIPVVVVCAFRTLSDSMKALMVSGKNMISTGKMSAADYNTCQQIVCSSDGSLQLICW